MTEDLEGAIRAALARRDRVREPLSGLARVTRDNAFIDDVIAAALAWAAGDSDDVTLRRRQVLARDGWAAP